MDRSHVPTPAPAGCDGSTIRFSKVLRDRVQDIHTDLGLAASHAQAGRYDSARALLADVSCKTDDLAGLLDAIGTPAPAGAGR